MRVLFVVRSLDMGGAQRQLVATARGLRGRGHDVSVAVFYGGGLFEDDLATAGIPIHDLRRSSRWESASFMARMVRLLRRVRPDVLYAYMGGANLFSAVLKPLFPPLKVVWGIRDALQDLAPYGRLTRLSAAIERPVSLTADAIIANSRAARTECLARGLDARKIMVIPNGIDCSVFQPARAEGVEVRRAWGVPADAHVVGMVARVDPVKGHDTFLRAAGRIAAADPAARFVCIGTGRPEYRERLARVAREARVEDRVLWLGEQRVTRAVYSAFDVAVLSSNMGESFPNVVAEAMACGTPCVVTDSGDLRALVGDAGVVVAPRDAEALAAGIGALLADEASRVALGERARSRIEREYSVARLVSRTETALEQVVSALPLRLVPRPKSGALPFTDIAPQG